MGDVEALDPTPAPIRGEKIELVHISLDFGFIPVNLLFNKANKQAYQHIIVLISLSS